MHLFNRQRKMQLQLLLLGELKGERFADCIRILAQVASVLSLLRGTESATDVIVDPAKVTEPTGM